ncbi:hypothetical protein F751_4457 [Auxenochlorella protothecoides]|uniref:Uncharacterized protein n=1 Tax=Auxenochlorella protothecoides TaxID=3075 RepID=A0A087SN83_AUXPR|nr:hypothetical protein F751_4457 [Auxenochlorella protothecoides]KFM27187.1 hypothetical protein F751_4457 [Auxenochlorella protothecoides]
MPQHGSPHTSHTPRMQPIHTRAQTRGYAQHHPPAHGVGVDARGDAAHGLEPGIAAGVGHQVTVLTRRDGKARGVGQHARAARGRLPAELHAQARGVMCGAGQAVVHLQDEGADGRAGAHREAGALGQGHRRRILAPAVQHVLVVGHGAHLLHLAVPDREVGPGRGSTAWGGMGMAR